MLSVNGFAPDRDGDVSFAYVDSASYDPEYGDPPTPAILFKHGESVVAAVDASAFVIDGMVDGVEVTGGNLVITFNTAAGKRPISIPLTLFFDPSEYYDKEAADARFALRSEVNAVAGDVSALRTAVSGMDAKIPVQASAGNQLADKEFVNSSVATNTATFRGTYNLVTDLSLPTSATKGQVAAAVAAKLASLSVVPENNDYCFVQIPTADATPAEISRIDRYKCTVATEGGTTTRTWGYEFSLNNSSFTAGQWAAINSGITSGLVAKLDALPTAEALAQVLAGKLSKAGDTMTGALTVPKLTVGTRDSQYNAGTYSTAEGEDNTAIGFAAHAEGGNTYASGAYSHAEGYGTVATSNPAVHAEGYQTTALGAGSHAEGGSTETKNEYEHAEGRHNVSHKAASNWGNPGNTLSSTGFGPNAYAKKNAVETMQDGKTFFYGLGGYDGTNPTEATDLATVVNAKAGRVSPATDGDIASLDANGNLKLSGMNRDANGNLNATEFTYTQSQVADYDSAAVGTIINKANTPVVLHSGEHWLVRKSFVKTSSGWSVDSVTGRIIKPGATGIGSTAWGEATSANGNGADSEGKNTRASGAGAHAEGQDTDATATCAHSEGLGTKAQNLAEHAQGQYNASHTGSTNSEKTLHSIGIGTADNARKNAVEVMQDGKVFVNGVGGYDGTNPTSATDFAALVNGKLGKMEAIAWSDLKAKRDNGNLVPGQQYRITDYVATTSGDMESRSANHPFDIVVTADSANELNEAARAIQHEGDTYFAGCDLAAWELMYCLDNDTTRFAWAVADGQTDAVTGTGGRGVIYRMVDEFNNDVPYDFKGLQFKAYGDTDNVWRYTFDSGDSSGNTDLSKSGLSQNVYKNTISPYSSGTRKLNRIVFKGAGCYSNTFGSGCFFNTFGNGCSFNTFGNGCSYNTFGNSCSSNTFGNSCSSNTFGSGVIRASFSYSSSYNAGTYFRIQGVVYRMVAPYKGSFSTAKQFEADDRLYYATTSKYYKCVVAHQGAWNASHFEEVPQFGEGGVLVEDSTVVKSYYRYVTFQGGIQYVALNCPNTTSSAYYQNVELKSGVAGSQGDPKLITDTNVNQDSHTTYKPADSQEISV